MDKISKNILDRMPKVIKYSSDGTESKDYKVIITNSSSDYMDYGRIAINISKKHNIPVLVAPHFKEETSKEVSRRERMTLVFDAVKIVDIAKELKDDRIVISGCHSGVGRHIAEFLKKQTMIAMPVKNKGRGKGKKRKSWESPYTF
mgnify:CR=1 FL=1